jgi:hypothetical protein
VGVAAVVVTSQVVQVPFQTVLEVQAVAETQQPQTKLLVETEAQILEVAAVEHKKGQIQSQMFLAATVVLV